MKTSVQQKQTYQFWKLHERQMSSSVQQKKWIFLYSIDIDQQWWKGRAYLELRGIKSHSPVTNHPPKKNRIKFLNVHEEWQERGEYRLEQQEGNPIKSVEEWKELYPLKGCICLIFKKGENCYNF